MLHLGIRSSPWLIPTIRSSVALTVFPGSFLQLTPPLGQLLVSLRTLASPIRPALWYTVNSILVILSRSFPTQIYHHVQYFKSACWVQLSGDTSYLEVWTEVRSKWDDSWWSGLRSVGHSNLIAGLGACPSLFLKNHVWFLSRQCITWKVASASGTNTPLQPY